MNTGKNTTLTRGVNWGLIYLYMLLVLIGLASIYAVEYRMDDSLFNVITQGSGQFNRQLTWVGISAIIATIILLIDSKFYTATANLLYLGGIFLLLLVVVIGKDIKGSESWLVIGSFQFQPAELTKITTLLALGKYLSNMEVDFNRHRSRLIASGLILLPVAIILLQNETGLALVYFSYFLVLYREGLPGVILVIAFALIALVLSTLLIEKITLVIILTVLAGLTVYFTFKTIRRKKSLLFFIIGLWAFCATFVLVVVPYTFNKVLQPYQVDRIYVMVGKGEDRWSDYNVRQSKIAIGSGGVLGKGYLKGTQTRFNFVPEQSTDFIFCTIGEDFGFVGSLALLLIYGLLIYQVIKVAERQRSTFSRVYGYGVACIFLFHVVVNIGMTIGLMPVIGIPLPFISYGGSSLLSFTILLFILIKLDTDRQMIVR